MLWMPSWGGMINGIMTLSGAWDKLRTDPVLRMMVVSVAFYGMSTFEGPMMSVKIVNSLSHYTDWTIGHVHSGALGWGRLHLLWSACTAWCRGFGIGRFIRSNWSTGILDIDHRNRAVHQRDVGIWNSPGTNVARLYESWVSRIFLRRDRGGDASLLCHRAMGGGLFLAGALLMAFNLWKTVNAAVSEAPADLRLAPAE
jgi:cytochrome c oxidase cbb3-type subunit 1